MRRRKIKQTTKSSIKAGVNIVLLALLILIFIFYLVFTYQKQIFGIAGISNSKTDNFTQKIEDLKFISPSPTRTPTPTPTPIINNYQNNGQTNNLNAQWGVAKQTGSDTWSQQIGCDNKMGTPDDVFQALNNYRHVHNVGGLTWNDNLAAEAQSRADYFNSIGKIDDHVGLNDFLNNQNGFNKLGFGYVGENSSLGQCPLLGVHIIEWIFASDQPHNANQLNRDWGYVGVGVSGYAVDLIFGADKY